MSETVKACPQCGLHYESHCFHYGISDGYKVQSVEMTPKEAVELLEGYINQLEYELENAKNDLYYYQRKIDGN